MALSDEDVAMLADRRWSKVWHLVGTSIWQLVADLAAEVQRLRAENAELRAELKQCTPLLPPKGYRR